MSGQFVRPKQRPQRRTISGQGFAGGSFERVPDRGRHGLSRQELGVLLREQGNRCAICGTYEWGTLGPMVDHDHELAKQHGHNEYKGCRRCVRQLCCGRCNTLLGNAQDDPEILRQAAAYLDHFNARRGVS
ncbi:MAG: hypothetical protein C0498_01675 [Anaerolinea sp.]|nr:hypothetical protein [Anaerolinea sp.]